MSGGDEIRFVAGVLVGGRSRRMGQPKATLALPGGESLVEHVVNAARQVDRVDEVVLLGRCAGLPEAVGSLKVLEDTEPGGGPMAGLCSLLAHAGTRWGLLLACDLPLLEAGLLVRLCDEARADVDVVAYRRTDGADGWHACCAAYVPRLLDAALEQVTRGRRSLHALLDSARVAGIEPSPEEQRGLRNLNTPEDYARLARGE